jgi:hypothetical protein
MPSFLAQPPSPARLSLIRARLGCPSLGLPVPCRSITHPAQNAVDLPGNIKHCRIGGQENRQDDKDDLEDTAREKRTYGGADCEDRANHGRKEWVLQFAPGAGLYVVLLRHATKVARDRYTSR